MTKTQTYSLSSLGFSSNDLVFVMGAMTYQYYTDYGDQGYGEAIVLGQSSWRYSVSGNTLTVTADLYYSDRVWYPESEYEGHRIEYVKFDYYIYKVSP